MLGDLQSQGLRIVEEEDDSDVVLINTCGFVEDAKRESVAAIMAASGQTTKSGALRHVVVTGCLAQRYADELAQSIPEVDAVIGFAHYNELGPRVRALVSDGNVEETEVAVGAPTVPFRDEGVRVRLGEKHSVYVRLAEGCDHACTFCAIPGFRGKFRSKPWDAAMSEMRTLSERGAVELVLVAEDTNQYGVDFGAKDPRRLSHLLKAVASERLAKWVRLLYCYPSYFDDELIDAMASLDNVCKYVDMPLQHASESVLRAMRRPSRAHTERLLAKLRSRIPDLCVRTTFIVGFPGETKADYQDLLDFVRTQRFHRAGFFAYSSEDGTPAAELGEHVPEEVKLARVDELVEVQQGIQDEVAQAKVGSVMEVLIDRVEHGMSIGRTSHDAPEIDGVVHVLQKFEPGTFVQCRILGTSSFDLYGEPVDSEVANNLTK